MTPKHLLSAAALLGLGACVDTTPALQPGTGAPNVTIQTNVTNGSAPSMLLMTRRVSLHVASLNSDCSIKTYLGRSPMGTQPNLALPPSQTYAFEIVINVKAGFDTVSKKSLERSIFVRAGHRYILDAQLAPNNDLVDLYEVSPNGSKRRVDTDAC